MWQPSVAALKSLIKHNFDGARAAGLGNLLENFFGNFAASCGSCGFFEAGQRQWLLSGSAAEVGFMYLICARFDFDFYVVLCCCVEEVGVAHSSAIMMANYRERERRRERVGRKPFTRQNWKQNFKALA